MCEEVYLVVIRKQAAATRNRSCSIKLSLMPLKTTYLFRIVREYYTIYLLSALYLRCLARRRVNHTQSESISTSCVNSRICVSSCFASSFLKFCLLYSAPSDFVTAFCGSSSIFMKSCCASGMIDLCNSDLLAVGLFFSFLNPYRRSSLLKSIVFQLNCETYFSLLFN